MAAIMHSRLRAVTAAVLVALSCFAVWTSFTSGSARGSAARLGAWTLRGSTTLPVGQADQGVATVTLASGRTLTVVRGGASVPDPLRDAGWIHIGDPDAYGHYLLDAYQGRPGVHAKLFVVTSQDGRRIQYVHRLVRGESFHNSFAAIAPGGKWFVSGEWGTMRRLLVFPAPQRNSLARRSLPLSGVITLNRPVRNVQGCAFNSATTLVCSTNDPGTDLFPVAKQLLLVRLAQPLGRHSTTASVTLLGAVPSDPTCPGSGETEGVDIHGNRLLLSVVSPCHDVARIYTFTEAAQAAPALT